MPAVSAIIPAYNAASTVVRAVQSALSQEGVHVDVVLVDDRSTDGTVDRVRALNDARVRVVEAERNAGPSAARNQGVAAAQCDFVAFLDADDAWEPSKLGKQLALFDRDRDVTLVTCDSTIFRTNGEVLLHHRSVPVAEGRDAWKTLLRGNFIPTPTVLCRKADILAVGGFDESMSFAEDLDLWVRLALRGSVRVVREPLVNIYGQPNSLSKSQRRAEARFLLPTVEKYLSSAAHRLRWAERRAIRGEVCFNVGYRSYQADDYAVAAPQLVRAALCGWRVPRALFFAVDASLGGPVNRMRRAWLRSRPRR